MTLKTHRINDITGHLIACLGMDRPTALYAPALSDKIGVLGITEEPPRPFKNVLVDRLRVYLKPRYVNTTLDLEKNREDVLRESGFPEEYVNVIALACTSMSMVGPVNKLFNKYGIPAIDSVRAAGFVLY